MFVQARDPIPQLKKYILEAKLLSEGQIKDIEKEVLDVVDEAVKFADESPKPVSLNPQKFGQLGSSGLLQLAACAISLSLYKPISNYHQHERHCQMHSLPKV